MSSQTFSQPLSSMPEFFTQDAFRTPPDDGADCDLRTPPEREMVVAERKVTAKMLKFVTFNEVVRMTVFVEHTLEQGVGGVPAHVRLLTADHDDGKHVYAILETEQYRYSGPVGGGEAGVPYELRGIVVGHRCVVPLHWTRLPGDKVKTDKEIKEFLGRVARTYALTNDPRFAHMFAIGEISDEVQPLTPWDEKVDVLDQYTNSESI